MVFHRRFVRTLLRHAYAETLLISRTYRLNGATAYTAGLNFVVTDFKFNPTDSPTYLPEAPIAAFSLYIFGIAFAPIMTPHIVERIGRQFVYFGSITLCGLFLLGGE